LYYTYKFRLYPNDEQKLFLNQEIGNVRFVYNYFLNMQLNLYKDEKKSFNGYAFTKMLPKLKEEFEFLKKSNSQSLQLAIIHNLKSAFVNFFEKRTSFPKFKSKKQTNSIIIPITNNNVKLLDHNRKFGFLKIPKLKSLIKFRRHRKVLGTLKRISITKTNSGNYFLNILVKKEDIPDLPKTNKSIGIDLGLTDFCTLSNNTKINNPRKYRSLLKQLKKLQQSLSRKTKDSKNFTKAKTKLAKFHEKIVNFRNDFLHKLSYDLIKQYDHIFIEDLSIKDMIKNKHLSLSIADASWGRFVSFLEYKAQFYGKSIVKIDRFFPSSKLCSNCGSVKSELSLNERVFRCPECSFEIDRDYNASINIYKEGLKILGLGQAEVTPVES